MKILAIAKAKAGKTPEDLGPYRVAEAKHAWELYKQGVFRELYFRTDAPGVVVVAECQDIEAARKITATLPMVEAGLIDFDYMALGAFVAFEDLHTQK